MNSANRIYGFLISLLGFSQGCSTIGGHSDLYGPPPVPAYGCPAARHIISGRVTGQNNDPIKDIVVKIKSIDHNIDGGVFTNSNGEYVFEETSPLTNITYNITFKDIDGAENGGEFADKKEEVVFKDEDFLNPDGEWYNGEVKKVVDVVMEEKTE